MNAMNLAGTIAVVCLAVVICLAAFGPMLVQDRTTGNPGGALDNIKISIENINQALEDGSLGQFLAEIDAATE